MRRRRRSPPAATRNTPVASACARDLRTRRHSSAERPLRREMRRPAGARDYRSHISRLIGTHYQQDVDLDQALHGRRGLQPARDGPRPRRQRRRRGREDGARPSNGRASSRSRRTSRIGHQRRRAMRTPTSRLTGRLVRSARPVPPATQLQAAAHASTPDRSVVILAGRGCLRAREEVLALVRERWAHRS